MARYANILAISLSKYACPLFLKIKKPLILQTDQGLFSKTVWIA
jgi:hypothetical protein